MVFGILGGAIVLFAWGRPRVEPSLMSEMEPPRIPPTNSATTKRHVAAREAAKTPELRLAP